MNIMLFNNIVECSVVQHLLHKLDLVITYLFFSLYSSLKKGKITAVNEEPEMQSTLSENAPTVTTC